MLPGPLESLQDLINDLVRTFNMDFNLGKDQAKDIMPHCRAAIEKYIYNKLNDHLLAIYAFKNREQDGQFRQKQRRLLQAYREKHTSSPMEPYFEIMKELDIKNKLMLLSSDQEETKSALNESLISMVKASGTKVNELYHAVNQTEPRFDEPASPGIENNSRPSELMYAGAGGSRESQSAQAPQPHQSTDQQIESAVRGNLMPTIYHPPYWEAICSLNKIARCITPREKLQCLSDSFSAMKTAVVDHHKGKLELSSMDDVLPLSIYVVSQVDVPLLASQFHQMDDFLKINAALGKRGGGFNYDLEKKLLTNFNCGVLYISHEWKVPE